MLCNHTGTFGDIALGKAASESMLAQGRSVFATSPQDSRPAFTRR